VLFYAHPLAAEPAFQDQTKQQQKKETTTTTVTSVNGTTETRDASAAQLADAATAINIPVNFDETPPVMAAATTTSGDKDAVKLIAAAPSQNYLATAYNLSGRTASGKPVSKGIIAADPGVLPLGTRVRLEAGSYSGEYLVADTGGSVRGRKIDVWVPTTHEACRFGRRSVKLTILAYGNKGKRQK
jgi:3D (Asp-Asp-Asp) domain-containing protein